MNLHIAQTQGARVECSTISRTAFQLISAQNCAPVMGCVQNTLVCNYILTETFTTPGDTDADSEPNYRFEGEAAGGGPPAGYQTLVDRDDFMAAVEAAGIVAERVEDLISRAAEVYPEYIRKGKTLKRKIPGKLAVSIVFPRNFTWSRKTDINPFLPIVKIVKGVIQPDSGPICKKTIGGCGGSAIHALWKMSPDLSMRLITELQFMTTVFISRIGFSIGISDCLPTEDELIRHTVHEALIKCEMINGSGKDKDEKEMDIVGALNGAMGIAPVLARTKMNKGDRNALVIMKKSGAKGSDTNNGQISAFVGSQCIDGKRMPYMLSDGKRSLPHFFIGDNSPEARGFVKNSYLDGLTYQETWFHAAAGRRGVVDTAMKSVVADTKIMIGVGSETAKIVEIGPWIDVLLEKHPENVKILGVDKDMELLDLRDIGSVHIPTVDTQGNVSWGLITHITRHSPTATLYRIKTRYGREVTVTDSKSLLVWNFLHSRVDQVQATSVKVGNYVPVTMKLPKPPCGTLKGGGGGENPSPPEIKLALFNRKGIFCELNLNGEPTPIVSKDLLIRGDIVLDEIVSIDRLPGNVHRYVYDLTIPSTTNFCLANGLHVVDTADSGYIQKKIVKKIEDCKVYHDGTVRDANKNIMQFLYGGDGFNAKELLPTKHTPQPFFINLQNVADCLNAEADLLVPTPKGGIGKLRVLKREEVDLMVSFIQVGAPGFQTEVVERATFNIKTILRVCVAEIKIYEYMIPMFCRKIKDEFEEAKAKMGYMAGLVAASSIGEPTTQLTLNSFHFTGQSAKDVTLGVPRLKELLNVTKKPSKPTCSIYLSDATLEILFEKRKLAKEGGEEEVLAELDSEGLRHTAKLSTAFAEKTVKYFMKSFDLQYVRNKKGVKPKASPIGLVSYSEYEPSWWVEASKNLVGGKSSTNVEPNVWVIIIELDINLLYVNSVTPVEIATKIEEEYGDRDNAFCCIASPACIGQIEVYINFTEIGSYTRDRLSAESRGNLLTPKNIDYFTVRDVAVNLIETVVVSGIKGITKTYIHQKPDTGEWTVDTQGTALAQILAHPLVDPTRTMSDNVWEVYRIFGIEATRKFLIKEITKILSFDGTYINPRHITLLVDAMCRTGYPTSVNRDGIARDVGPLAKGMFEKAVENFAESAAFGEHDIMQGVSAAVMMGTAPFVGTGTVDIKDEETLPVIRY